MMYGCVAEHHDSTEMLQYNSAFIEVIPEEQCYCDSNIFFDEFTDLNSKKSTVHFNPCTI